MSEADLKDDLSNYNKDAYEKPSVTVDIIICTIMFGQLKVLLIKRKHPPYRNHWAIPGGFVEIPKEETLEEAAARELQEETGLKSMYIEQLKTYGDPHRDPRLRVITVAYYALVPAHKFKDQKIEAGDDAKETAWFSLMSPPENLAFDHRNILGDVRSRIFNKLEYTNIAFEFLPKMFTWTELQSVFESILGRELIASNFRRWIKMHYNIVQVKNKKKAPENGIGRPSALLEYKGTKDTI
jgi:8-oxo-dGTP diphosphatase